MDTLEDYETDEFEGTYQLCKFGIYENSEFKLKLGPTLDWIKSKKGLTPIWSKTDAENGKQFFIFFNISRKRWEVHEMVMPDISMTIDHLYCPIGLYNYSFFSKSFVNYILRNIACIRLLDYI